MKTRNTYFKELCFMYWFIAFASVLIIAVIAFSIFKALNEFKKIIEKDQQSCENDENSFANNLYQKKIIIENHKLQ